MSWWPKGITRDARRDALRHGAQSALAAVATYGLMRLLDLGEVYIAILSAVLILQPSIGGTMGAALSRLQATVVGSLLGLACLILLPEAWGTTAALAVSMLVVGGAAGLRSDWTYGAVAAVAIALAPSGDALDTTGARGLAIVLGAGVGVLVSLLVWPDRAESRFERHFRTALKATATRLTDAVEATLHEGRPAAPPDHVSAYHGAVQNAQEAIDAAKLVDREGMRRRLDALRLLYNSIIILDRAAEAEAPPEAGAGRLREEVDALRRDACEVLTSLAEGDRTPGPGIRRMDRALGALHDSLASDDPASDRYRTRAALAFGLQEVRRTLAALVEAQLGRDAASRPDSRR